MTRTAVRSRSLWHSLLAVVVGLSALTCTGAGTPGGEGGDSSTKIDTIRQLEQKTLSLAPPLVQATVGLSIMRGMGAGSGVIVSEDGLILTAGHVVPPPGEELIVQFSDGKKVKAKALGADKGIDTGLAQITEKGKYPFVKMGKSSTLKKGDWVLAIGNPGGYRPDRKPPIRLGRVLSLPNRDANALWIVTDATVAPGDSGGPLFNMDGEVIGIHSNISPEVTQNRHVAIDDFTKRWETMMAGKVSGKMFSSGTGTRPQLGVDPVDRDGKVRIENIVKESPAEKAGLKVGDIIKNINGKDIVKAEDIYALVRKARSGNEFKMLVIRDGDEKEITAKLAEGPRTYENPPEELEEFFKQNGNGYKRPDGVWEFQPVESNEKEFRRILARIADRRDKASASGEMRIKDDTKKNSPELLKALNELSLPVAKSLALIYNGSEKSEGDFDDKPSVIGTIISPDGYILTKASELKKEFYVKIADKEYDGKLVGKREDYDLALIKVDAKDLKPVKWASQSDPSPGAITVTAVLDNKGEAKAVALGIVSNAAREIGSSLSANKAVLGVQFALDTDLPKLDVITKNGPADKAGIKSGDIILSVNGTKADSREKIQGLIKPFKPGETITLEIKRGEETKKIDVKLGSRSEVFANLPGNRSDFQTQMFERAAGVSKRKEDFPDALTHDSALRNTQMGTPLLNLTGQAIGLNIARFDRTGSYAITYKTLQPIIEKMIEENKK
ncbi:MAG TPA: trypsin-like peptidase domain-containing protein [Gemmatales bacterium]|nr:trypsin-like peptidase domain-containing protein [Gemmatales bacterium]